MAHTTLSMPRRFLTVIGPDARGIPWLVVQMLLVALLELVTIGGIPPMIALLTRSGQTARAPGMNFLYAIMGPATNESLVWRFGLILLLLFFAKALLSAATSYRQFRFSYDVQMRIGRRMLQGLLGQDYVFFLQQNTAILLKNVTSEVLLFTGGVLIPGLQLVTQALILLTMIGLLTWASPLAAAVTVALMGGMVGLLYLAVHHRLTAWGVIRENMLAELSRTTHQAFAGVKAVKTTGSEKLYVDDFARHGAAYARSNTLYQTAAVTPPLIIELVLFGGAIAVMMYYSTGRGDLRTLLPLATLFGVAAYRILPGARLIFAHIVTIRYNLQSLNIIYEALDDWNTVAPKDSAAIIQRVAPRPLMREIRLVDVSYVYPDAERPAVRNVSVTIRAGTHVAFVGSSGAGKTTVMDLILGLLDPTSGEILIDGERLDSALRPRWQRTIGYVPQQVFLADATLSENIAFGVPPEAIDETAIRAVVQQACLTALVARLPNGLNTQLGENGARLSGGERQRVAIARALYNSPSVLILDEATSALDSMTEREVNDELLQTRSDLTIIIVTHRLGTVRNCDRLIMIKDGGVQGEGGFEELVRENQDFAEMERLAVGS